MYGQGTRSPMISYCDISGNYNFELSNRTKIFRGKLGVYCLALLTSFIF